MTHYYIINGTIVFLILICIITSYLSYKKMRDKLFLIFSIYYLASFITEIGSYLYSYYTNKSNHFIYNSFLFITIAFFTLIFKAKIKNVVLNKITFIINALIFVYAVVNLFFFQGVYIYNTYTHYLETYFIMLSCVFYFYDVLRTDTIILPLKEYFFWIASGIFISNMCSITYYLLFYDIVKTNIDPRGVIYEYINFVSKLIEYSFAILAFVYASRWKRNN